MKTVIDECVLRPAGGGMVELTGSEQLGNVWLGVALSGDGVAVELNWYEVQQLGRALIDAANRAFQQRPGQSPPISMKRGSDA